MSYIVDRLDEISLYVEGLLKVRVHRLLYLLCDEEAFREVVLHQTCDVAICLRELQAEEEPESLVEGVVEVYFFNLCDVGVTRGEPPSGVRKTYVVGRWIFWLRGLD